MVYFRILECYQISIFVQLLALKLKFPIDFDTQLAVTICHNYFYCNLPSQIFILDLFSLFDDSLQNGGHLGFGSLLGYLGWSQKQVPMVGSRWGFICVILGQKIKS